jgi:hypothetical protein
MWVRDLNLFSWRVNGLLAFAVALAVSLSCCGRADKAVVAPVPIANKTFDSAEDIPVTATVAFVSDDLIAIGRHSALPGDLSGTLTTVEWRAGRLRVLNSRPVEKYRSFSSGLFRAGHGQLISSVERPPLLLAGDLSDVAELPIRFVIPPVAGGAVAGDQHGFNGWDVYRLDKAAARVRQGFGELLALSDDLVVFRSNDAMSVESMKGQRLGSFAVPPRSKCPEKAFLLGSEHLYVSGCGPGLIADFSGKRIRQIPEPDGWGFRFGSTQDGHRLLFDNFTRRISGLQRMGEAVEEVLTLGLGPIVQSKGEEIRVVDTNTGKTCFDLDNAEQQLGRAGEIHADISPSGQFVAVSSGEKLSIYPLPEVCGR